MCTPHDHTHTWHNLESQVWWLTPVLPALSTELPLAGGQPRLQRSSVAHKSDVKTMRAEQGAKPCLKSRTTWDDTDHVRRHVWRAHPDPCLRPGVRLLFWLTLTHDNVIVPLARSTPRMWDCWKGPAGPLEPYCVAVFQDSRASWRPTWLRAVCFFLQLTLGHWRKQHTLLFWD